MGSTSPAATAANRGTAPQDQKDLKCFKTHEHTLETAYVAEMFQPYTVRYVASSEFYMIPDVMTLFSSCHTCQCIQLLVKSFSLIAYRWASFRQTK